MDLMTVYKRTRLITPTLAALALCPANPALTQLPLEGGEQSASAATHGQVMGTAWLMSLMKWQEA